MVTSTALQHPTARRLGLALCGAALLASAVPPHDLWPFALCGWVPLALLAAEGNARRAALLGWLQGVVGEGFVLASVPSALHRAGGASLALSVALAALLVGFEGARFGVVAWLTARALRNGWPLLLAFPVSLVTAEFLYPMFFPWGSWLFVQRVPLLLQTAELGGPLTVSLWVGVVNAGLASAWPQRFSDRARWLCHALAVPGLTSGAVVVFGALRMRAVDARAKEAPSLRIGIVQGNVTLGSPASADPLSEYRKAALELFSEKRPDLLLLPETAIDVPVAPEDLQRVLSAQYFHPSSGSAAAPAIDVPLLAGVVLERRVSGRSDRVRILDSKGRWPTEAKQRFNSAVLADPDGTVRGTYDKRELVLLGEIMPGGEAFPWLRRLLPTAADFTAGSSTDPLIFADKRILVSICYEDMLPETMREALGRADADLLVNLTSDSWFGTSRVPLLHFALAKLRAVEHRRFLVRATNTGVSAVVDPAGRSVAQLEPHRPASMVADVRWMRARTPYEALGNIPWYVVAAGAAALVLFRRRGAAVPAPARWNIALPSGPTDPAPRSYPPSRRDW
jgi:apolipoprotein N-acyltransferase